MHYYTWKTETLNDNSNRIKLVLPPITDEELPYVSIVTPTYNRPDFINLMIRNYTAIDYPREKLEWIVVDDSPEFIDFEPLKKLGAKIFRCPKKLKLGHKRNFINCLAKYSYIVHLDDDDFYPSYSVISRIRVLLEYEKEKQTKSVCVACRFVNCYDLITDKTFEAYDVSKETISESTLAYSKQFWKENSFNNDDTITECINFIKDREVCLIPSSYVITQLTHNNNTIVRRPDETSTMSFLNMLNTQDYNVINELKVKLVMKLMKENPVFNYAMNFVKDIKSSQNPPKKALELFDELEYKAKQQIEHKSTQVYSDNIDYVEVLKHPLVLNIRRELLCTKKNFSKDTKTIVYYCGPSTLFQHKYEWNPESEFLGGSEEAVVYLSEEFVKNGYNVVVYNTVNATKKYNGVLYKPYYLWNPKDCTDITIFWRDPFILKEVQDINSKKIFIDMHDAIPIKEYIKCDAIFVKSEYHKSLVNELNNIVVVPNGIKTIMKSHNENNLKNPNENNLKNANMALCTSSPDRCLSALLNVLPIIREKYPDFKIYWAYGFSSGINRGGISESKDASIMKWHEEIKEKMLSTEGFVDLGRLSQDEINEYYKQAKYYIYGTNFPETDCISLTKALYHGCVPLMAGTGAIPEKLKKLNISFVETEPVNNNVIDTSLQSDTEEFNNWVQLIFSELDKNENENNITNEIENMYSWKNICKKWFLIF